MPGFKSCQNPGLHEPMKPVLVRFHGLLTSLNVFFIKWINHAKADEEMKDPSSSVVFVPNGTGFYWARTGFTRWWCLNWRTRTTTTWNETTRLARTAAAPSRSARWWCSTPVISPINRPNSSFMVVTRMAEPQTRLWTVLQVGFDYHIAGANCSDHQGATD